MWSFPTLRCRSWSGCHGQTSPSHALLLYDDPICHLCYSIFGSLCMHWSQFGARKENVKHGEYKNPQIIISTHMYVSNRIYSNKEYYISDIHFC